MLMHACTYKHFYPCTVCICSVAMSCSPSIYRFHERIKVTRHAFIGCKTHSNNDHVSWKTLKLHNTVIDSIQHIPIQDQ